jgi:hypothetical protein
VPDWLAWLLPVPLATLAAAGWASWAGRAPRPPQPRDSVEAHARFLRALGGAPPGRRAR